MKLLIIGYGRGGKDSLAEYLSEKYGLKFKSSSEFACDRAIYPAIKEMMGYKSSLECYEDRHNHRALWHELIKAYNYKDRKRLAEEMLSEGYEIYVGMRCVKELEASRDLFNWVIWVDGTERTGYVEPEESCSITKKMAHIVITNNGTIKEFHNQIDELMYFIS